ncbi:hypothetical protein F5Y05DRAFT_389461 [Hypoxylon sp. FL0543]|nr:hypothetical protein F5Y05DRAFT_389461 [Hypoxylon sp. FL0543]
MGGLAFSSGDKPLHTPRMSPIVYQHALNECHAKLQELFVVVATPIPGPGKKDHGDIDIFLAWDKSSVFPSPLVHNLLASLSPTAHDPLEASAHLLNAERYIREQPKVIITAIPWHQGLPLQQEAKSESAKELEDIGIPRYIQVDLHQYDSLEQLQWMLFKHAHGDLWNLLRSTIRPYGLTIDDTGLHLRIPEIENLNKNQAKVLLSTEPTDILDFLGLKYDGAQWEEPFATVEDLFEYAATCRLFWVRPENEEDSAAVQGGEIAKTKLKSNDRRRMNFRPVFRKWVDEFLPARRAAAHSIKPTATRDSVREEAFEFFPGTRQAYEARLMEWRKERQRQTLWKEVIKASIPKALEGEEKTLGNAHWRSNLAAALKKIIMQDDYSLGIRPQVPLREDNGLYDEERVRQFVKDSWWEVGRAAWKENQRRYAERQAEKEAGRNTSGSIEEEDAAMSLAVESTPREGDDLKSI